MSDHVSQQSVSALLMKVVGATAIILGGLVAAVTSPLSLSHGSWAAAYLVLVAGVALYVMGQARVRWGSSAGERGGLAQFALWNLGNIGVIGGTLLGSPWIVFAASALLVAALVLAFIGVIQGSGSVKGNSRTFTLLAYRAMLVVLAVSIPVGMLLSYLRNQ